MRDRFPVRTLPKGRPVTPADDSAAPSELLAGPARTMAIISILVMAFLLPARIGHEPESTSTQIGSQATYGSHAYREGELLVRFKEQMPESEVIARLEEQGVVDARRFEVASRPESPNNRLYLIHLAEGRSVSEVSEEIVLREDVEFAQPNFIHHKAEPPDDPFYEHQWGHENTGFSPVVPGLSGPDPRVADADMDTPEAGEAIAANGWTPDEIIVGVIDTGLDWGHEDLADNIWVNPGETAGNGADDDGNGKIDDIHGWDYRDNDGDPADEDGHGTHVAGAIAGITNNGKGISGVAPNARIIGLRFLGDEGGDTADAIDAIDYAVASGAKVLNNSWGGGGYETALETAIADAGAAGVIFVAAAGNDGTDNDVTPHYPSDYQLSNVISVAASNPWGQIADFSNFGAESVHIAAPGEEVCSTTPSGLGTMGLDSNYGYGFDLRPDWGRYVEWGGTSMAAPAVTGAVATLYGLGHEIWPSTWSSMLPSEQADAVIDRLLAGAEAWPALHGRVSTGGHLNLLNLIETDSIAPAPVSDFQVLHVGSDNATFRLTATGDDGLDGRAHRYDLRYAEVPLWTTFEDATPVRGAWRPREPGMWDYVFATGLSPGTDYQFQLRVLDNVGNASGLSDPVIVLTEPAAALFSDDMEAGPGGWTTQSNLPDAWALTSMSAHSGDYCWTDSHGSPYPGDLDSSLVSPAIDLTASGAARLDFWQMYDLDNGFDFGRVEATSNGVDWHTLLTVTGTHLSWTRQSLDLTPYTGGTVQIRFRIQTDSTINSDGWYVDDVFVFSTMPAPDLLVFEDTFETADNWDPGPGGWGLEAGGLSDSPGGDYPSANVSSARLIHPIHLETMETAVLSFDFVARNYQDRYDFLYLQVSTDGEWWRSLRRWTASAAPYREHVNLTEYAGQPEIWLRFLLSTDRDLTAPGAIIDNLRIETTSMPDGDSDGVVDPLDCEPADGGSFAPPTEIRNLRWKPGGIRLEWDSDAPNCGPGVVYDVLRAEAADMPFGSGGAGEICLADSTSNTFVDEHSLPDPGGSLCYLVRSANACGTSSYGMGTGSERSSSSCP